MKRLTVGIMATIMLSACNFEPVLTVAKKNETLLSPILYIVVIGLVIFIMNCDFYSHGKHKKTRKKLKH